MIKYKFILSYGIQFISLIISLVSGIIVARIGGPNVVGTLAFGMAFVSVFYFVSDLGLGTAHQKLVTSTDDNRDYISTFTVLKITTSFLFLIVIVSYYFIQVKLFNNHDIDNPEIRTVIFIYIAIYFIDSLNYIFRTNFIANAERAKVEIPTFLQSTLDKSSRIILITLGFGAIALAMSSLLLAILVLPINYYLFRNYKFGKFRIDLLKNYIVISLPVIVILFAQQWADNIDRILLREFHGTYELGLYMAAFSLSLPVKMLGSSISSILFPSFSSLLFQNKIEEIANLIIRYRRYLISIFFPFIILAMLYSSQLVLFLYGNKYIATITYFPFIIASLFIFIYTLPYLNLSYAKGLFTRIAIISIFILIVESALIFILSAKAGLNLKGLGAAIALLITNLILFIIYQRIAKKIIIIKRSNKESFLIIIQIGLGIISMMILKNDLLLIYITLPILYLALIFMFEWKLKIITKDDISFFLSFLNIKPLLKYVKDEIGEEKN